MRSTLLLALAARAAAQTVPVTTTTLDTRACIPGGPFAAAVYCNPKAALEDRVNDLVERLFAGDAASWVPPQLTARHGGGGSPGPMSNVSEVGLPEFNYGLNCAHGVQSSCARDAATSAATPAAAARREAAARARASASSASRAGAAAGGGAAGGGAAAPPPPAPPLHTMPPSPNGAALADAGAAGVSLHSTTGVYAVAASAAAPLSLYGAGDVAAVAGAGNAVVSGGVAASLAGGTSLTLLAGAADVPSTAAAH
jgi:hypothetical protein